MHAFIYQFKIMMRDRILLFWTLVFPLILATFFQLAFSNFTNSESFDPAKVAIVEKKENKSFSTMVDSLSSGENQLLDVRYQKEDKAKSLLENDEIEVSVRKTGISQTIVETIIKTYYQTMSTYENIYELKPEVFITGVLDNLDSNIDYFQAQENNHTEITVIYFYTLIGMACMFGGYWGLHVTTMIEANLSRQGTRINMAPTSKYKVLCSGIVAAFIFQYVTMLVLLGYLVFGLHVEFGNQIGYIALLMAMGSITGIAFGNVIGNLLKGSETTKVSIVTSISMMMSFLAGMMIIEIKYFLSTYFPIATYINPVSLITDALYSLYYYNTYDRYFFNLLCLGSITTILILLSLITMRKKRYDSI